jgi:hypothetical protein
MRRSKVDEEGTDRPERPEQPKRRGAAFAVPVVLMVVGALVLIGMFRKDQQDEPAPTPLPPVVPAASTFLYCSDCHGDLDKLFTDGERPMLLFTHDKHFGIGVSDCAACHVANTHEPDTINRPTMVTCYQCHTLEAGARAPGECSLCHPPELNPEPQTHLAANWVPDKHNVAAKANPFECATCHEQGFCNECHGLELPHPTDFSTRTHAETFFQDPALCEKCHVREPLVRRDTCDTCHHPQGPTSSTWIAWHPNVVGSRGAETCFQCHATDTCRACHRQGPENFTDEDLAADEALLGTSPSPAATTPPTPVAPTTGSTGTGATGATGATG